MKKTKLMALVLAMLMVVSMVAGCAKPAATETPVQAAAEAPKADGEKEVVELTFWDENPGSIQTPHNERFIEEFNELHDDIHVTYVGVPHDSARDKYFVAVESGTTPDVGSIEMFWLSNLMARDALVNMDEMFAAWDESDQFVDLYLNLSKSMSNGSLYMLPYTNFIDVLWYRTDWLAETGVEDLSSWDNFFTAVERMTDAENGRYGSPSFDTMFT